MMARTPVNTSKYNIISADGANASCKNAVAQQTGRESHAMSGCK
jgi:hypothetical protein